ncbi:MAG: glycosyltransferase family 1 protein [Candidatus Magasanikbacteria bacterium]|nr:glycosyltransferase family 1 protein [Candidatus Magasanikbacteria bacterium]
MIIGFDARFMSVPGGIPRYCRELLIEMSELEPETGFVVLVKNIPTDFPKRVNITWIETDIHWYSLREQFSLGRLMNAQNVDLWHIPHWNVPFTLRTPFVMTFHDFIFEHYPTHARNWRAAILWRIKLFLWRALLGYNIFRARAVITVSNFVKNQLVTRHVWAQKKITAIHLGLSRLPQPKKPHFAVEEPFFLVVGNSYPHKNHRIVFKTALELPGQRAHWYFLTHKDRFSEQLETEAQQLGLSNRVHYAFDASDETLAWMYEHCTALVLPSQSEGFGIPPLEAFSFGKPAIVARTSSLPEILGPLAQWFSPDSSSELATTLQHTLQHASTHSAALSETRKSHASRFTWRTTALSTLKIYRNVL